MEFCKFIEKNYKTRSLIESVDCMQKFLMTVKNSSGDKKKIGKSVDYILNNMRMTICELG